MPILSLPRNSASSRQTARLRLLSLAVAALLVRVPSTPVHPFCKMSQSHLCPTRALFFPPRYPASGDTPGMLSRCPRIMPASTEQDARPSRRRARPAVTRHKAAGRMGIPMGWHKCVHARRRPSSFDGMSGLPDNITSRPPPRLWHRSWPFIVTRDIRGLVELSLSEPLFFSSSDHRGFLRPDFS